MYSKYDNEEFEGYEKTNPSFKDTLIYREVQKNTFDLHGHFWFPPLTVYMCYRSQYTCRTAGRVTIWRS